MKTAQFAAIGAAALLTACTTATPQAANVRIVGAPQEVQGCTRIGNVRGDQNIYGGIFAGAAYDDALNQMKNKTAKAGGNTLLIISSSTGWAGANAMGDAYKCR